MLLGHNNVGKSSLIQRYVHHKFSEEYLSTIGVNIEKKVVNVGKEQIIFILWDIAGQATIDLLPQSYLLGLQGIIYVFDLQRKSTWENLLSQLHFLQEHYPFVPIKIVGNKQDLVTTQQIAQIRKDLEGISIFTSSAKSGENVDLIFNKLAETYIL